MKVAAILISFLTSVSAFAETENHVRVNFFYDAGDEEAYVLFQEASLQADDGDAVISLFDSLQVEAAPNQSGVPTKKLTLNSGLLEITVGRGMINFASGFFSVRPGSNCSVDGGHKTFSCVIAGVEARKAWTAFKHDESGKYSLVAYDDNTKKKMLIQSTETSLTVAIE